MKPRRKSPTVHELKTLRPFFGDVAAEAAKYGEAFSKNRPQTTCALDIQR